MVSSDPLWNDTFLPYLQRRVRLFWRRDEPAPVFKTVTYLQRRVRLFWRRDESAPVFKTVTNEKGYFEQMSDDCGRLLAP